jgi:hypothetical protein
MSNLRLLTLTYNFRICVQSLHLNAEIINEKTNKVSGEEYF